MRDNLPRVNILCMTFNHEKYISKTIRSFKQQNYVNCKFIIIDDCSSDSTYLNAKKEIGDDERIVLIRNDKNLGAALNSKKIIETGLRDADYIGFCEGDDYFINPERISKQLEFLQNNPRTSLVFTAAEIINELGEKLSVESHGNRLKYFKPWEVIFIGGNLCATASTLYRKEVLLDLPVNFYQYPVGDYPMQIIASFYGEVAYLPLIGAAYRQFSLSSWSRSMVCIDKYLSNHEETLIMLDELNFVSNKRYSRYFCLAKLKYWYFMSVNDKIPNLKRIKYIFNKGGFFKFVILFSVFSPLFNLLNRLRRFFRLIIARYYFG